MQNISDQELLSTAEKYFNGDINVAKIWYKKYTTSKETPQDAWKRIARITSEVEKEEKQKEIELKFYDLLKDGKFYPGGRIIFALTDDIKTKNHRKVTPFNCFALPDPEDNLESIFDIGQKAAKIYAHGGGVGISLSKLRPKGSKVGNAAVYSDGCVPFAQLYSEITSSIAISGRRGALILTLDDKSPDLLEFIHSKKDHSKINAANISVKLSDEFMRAVEKDEDWELYFKVKDTGEEIKQNYKARDIFDKIVKNNHTSAEPGVLYWTKIINYTPNAYFDESKIIGVNPCGEQPLPAFGNCNLGSLNLSKFVKYGFTKRAEFDWESFKDTIVSSVRFLDNVNEVAIKHKLFPFSEQIQETQNTRRIGLGVLGFADMLILLGKKYDSEEALQFCDELFKKMRDYSYEASCDLAVEKGAFKIWNYDKWAKSKFVQNLPDYIKEKAKITGVRNLTLTSIAPTGSLSILAGSSAAMEPIFSLQYDRKVNLGDNGSTQVMKFYHPLYKKFLEKTYDLPENVWVTAHDIDYHYRIKMQATAQKYICTAISSTINLPSNTTEETIWNIYMMAWREGLKGVCCYVDGSRSNILTTKKKRPMELQGSTYQIKNEMGSTFYVTINDIFEELKPRPFEIFISSKDNNENLNVITRLISAIFRRTSDSEFVIDQLIKSTKDESGLLNQLANILKFHFKKLNNKPILIKEDKKIISNVDTKNEAKADIKLETCPECGQKTLKVEAGCKQCTNPDCGWGACSV